MDSGRPASPPYDDFLDRLSAEDWDEVDRQPEVPVAARRKTASHQGLLTKPLRDVEKYAFFKPGSGYTETKNWNVDALKGRQKSKTYRLHALVFKEAGYDFLQIQRDQDTNKKTVTSEFRPNLVDAQGRRAFAIEPGYSKPSALDVERPTFGEEQKALRKRSAKKEEYANKTFPDLVVKKGPHGNPIALEVKVPFLAGRSFSKDNRREEKKQAFKELLGFNKDDKPIGKNQWGSQTDHLFHKEIGDRKSIMGEPGKQRLVIDINAIDMHKGDALTILRSYAADSEKRKQMHFDEVQFIHGGTDKSHSSQSISAGLRLSSVYQLNKNTGAVTATDKEEKFRTNRGLGPRRDKPEAIAAATQQPSFATHSTVLPVPSAASSSSSTFGIPTHATFLPLKPGAQLSFPGTSHRAGLNTTSSSSSPSSSSSSHHATHPVVSSAISTPLSTGDAAATSTRKRMLQDLPSGALPAKRVPHPPDANK